MASTRERLLDAALAVLATEGIAGASARVIAARADVNQALVFYHHGSVDELLAEASRTVTRQRAEVYADRLERIDTFAALAAEARELHREERAAGHLLVLTQLLAGARTRPALAAALQENFALLVAPVEAAIRRLVTGSVLEEVVAPDQLAHSIAGGFLGLQLLDGVVTDVEPGPFDTIDALATVVDLALDAGVLEASLLRRKLRRARPTR
jgi:AcrR family transcriptional regulator